MAESRSDIAPPGFFKVMRILASRKAFKHLSFACALHAFVTYGMGNFMPLFLGRIHDMPILDIGLYYGLIAGIGGLAGTFFGGWYSDRKSNQHGDMRWYIWVPFISTVAAIPLALITFIVMPDGYSAAFFYLLPCILRRLLPRTLHCSNAFFGGHPHARNGLCYFAVCLKPHRIGFRPDGDWLCQRLADPHIWQ